MTKELLRAGLALALLGGLLAGGSSRGAEVRPGEYLVNALDDPDENLIDYGDGIMTLREAILRANADQGASLIKFDASLQRGIIWLQRELPAITEGALEINGDANVGTGSPVMPIRILAPPASGDSGVFCLKVQSAGNSFRNIILGGSQAGGIQISGPSATLNLINACKLGVDPYATLTNDQMALSCGIRITGGASDNTVYGCLIANCGRAGIHIERSDCRRNIITRNVIGSPEAGVTGNATGIHLQGNSTLVGGVTDAAANIIAGNTLNGILVEGPGAMFNRILNNSFEANGRLAIDLSAIGGIGDGPTPDGHSGPPSSQGPNQWVAAPKLISYNRIPLPGGSYLYNIVGSCTVPMTVQVYQAAPDPLGYGEGKTVLITGSTGIDNSFAINFNGSPGLPLTLLGTDANGNTSEFSQVFTLGEGGDVTQLACWQNLYFIPAGVTRRVGIGTNRRAPANITLTVAISAPEVARVVTMPPIPAGATFTSLDVEGLEPGSATLSIALPSNAGGAACSTSLIVGDPTPVTIDPMTHLTDFLMNSGIPARLYKFQGTAGQLVNIEVSATPGSPIDPMVCLFDTGARNLAANSSFQASACFIQQLLPRDGEYYIAVNDLYFRTGSDWGFFLKLWRDTIADAVAGQPQLTERPPLAVQDRPSGMAFGDFNGDRFQDLVIPLPGRNAFQILFKDRGDALQFTHSFIQNLGFTPGAIAVADFDRDGRDDILVSDRTTHQVHVFYNTGQWTKSGPAGTENPTWRHRAFPASGSGSTGAASDFNLDDYPDYALLDSTAKTLSILLNDGLGNLAQAQTLAAGTEPLGLVSADFDGDGVPDLALADRGPETLLVWEGHGDGTFELSNALATIAEPTDLKATDLDLDGQSDLIACGDGDDVLVTYKSLQSFDFQLFQQLSTGSGPNSIALADLNADGFQDVSVSNSGSQDIYVYQGLRSGWLQPVAQISVDGQIEQLFWYSFGGSGSYFGIPADENFVRMLQGNYLVLNFLDTDVTSAYATAFALANPSAEAALLYLSLYGPDGALVTSSGVENPVAVSLSAAQQAAFFIADVFGGEVEAFQTWMRVSTLNQAVRGFSLQLSNAAEPFYDGAIAQTGGEPELLLPVIGTLAETGDAHVDLVNPGSEPASVTVTCRGADGAALSAPLQLQLPAKARVSFALREQFGQVSPPAYLQVAASQPLEGFQFTLAGGTMSAVNAIPVIARGAGETLLFGAHFAEGRLYRTVLNLVNAAGTAANVTVQAFQDDGSLMAAGLPVCVPPGGMLHGDLAALLGLDYQSADFITGYLRVQSDQPMLYGTLTFGDRENRTFSASLLLQESGLERMLFSHLAVGDVGGVNYFTGLTFLNTGAADASFHIAIHDQLGVPTGENTVVLPAGHKLSQMLTDFVDGLQPQGQGYIIVDVETAGAALFSFELFGDAGLNFLAAVPPQSR